MNQDPLAGLPVSEPWSLATGQAGQILIFLGLGLFLFSAIAASLSGRNSLLAKLGSIAFWGGSFTLFGAFGCLATLFAKNQFQFNYVFAHGDIHTAIQYKIAGVWSGQQGSFLLWATTSAIFGLLTLRGTGRFRPAYTAVFSAFLATLCGILSYETPFGILEIARQGTKVMVPASGQGLAPSLMNYWVVIHPPTIFMGFGSLTVMFAYAVAAIIHRDVKSWVAQVRSWALVSTGILGLGICMGGFWAYETLGWGGFWAWDPVENASFIPWIFVVAFVHGIIVQSGRKRWHGSNLWLGALPFLTFCYGTFLTRGGYLDKVSVHSFASMDKSALTILKVFLGIVVAGYVLLYLIRGFRLAKSADVPPVTAPGVHRENLYSSGVVLLTLTAAVLSLGMSWPLIMALTGHQVAKVEEGLYHKVVVWLFIPIMIAMAVTPFVGWRSTGGKQIVRRVANVFSLSVALAGVALLALRVPEWGVKAASNETVSMPMGFRMAAVPWVAFLFLLCVFTFVANLWRAFEMFRKSKISIGGFVAHIGFATLLGGLIMSRGLEQTERLDIWGDGTEASALGYTVKFAGLSTTDMMDRDGKAKFQITAPTGESFIVTPGLYYRPATDGNEDSAMTWPFIRRYPAHDFYFALGAPIVNVWDKPVWFHKGETKTVSGITVTYRKMTISGQPGTPSASFGADLHVAVSDPKSGTTQEYDVTPHFTVANGPDLPQFNKSLRVAVTRIDAADQSAEIQMFFASAVYPIEIFTKPLTGLVWTGCGIMTLGSLLAAYSRRRRRGAESPPSPIVESLQGTTDRQENATEA